MRLKLFVCILIMALLPMSVAFSEEKNLTGEVSVMAVLPYVAGDQARFNQYRDYKDGSIRPFAGGYLNFDNKKGYFFDFNASDIGYDTQRYSLEGGKYGSFKYHLLYDEIIHNFTWNARSFYAAPGSNVLTYTPVTGNRPNPDSATWNTFDYETKRKKFDMGASFNLMKPFFFSVDAGREKKEGTGWAGVAASSSNTAEIPMPIRYTTDHMRAEIGYGKQPFFAAFSYYYQRFMNENPYLFAQSPFPSGGPVNTVGQDPLAPKNDYQKFSFMGNMKLPFNSKFNAKADYGRATSDKDLVTTYWTTAATSTTVINNNSQFQGDVSTQNYNMVLTSAPFSFLNGKVFYQYYRKDNASDHIIVNPGPSQFTNPLFEYNKENYGAELDFRVVKGLHLIGGYAHTYIDRRRDPDDIPKNNDDLYKLEARYNLLDFATIRAGYEYLVRAANHDAEPDGGLTSQYTRVFDAAAQNRTTWKVDVQFYPLDNLNFNVMYKYIKADYKDTTLGITGTERNFWGFSADYAWTKWFKTYGYLDWDQLQRDQFQRRGNSDPFGATQNSTNFNWTAVQMETNYDWGLGVDVYAIPKKLTIRASYDSVRSNGNTDLTYLSTAALSTLFPGQNNDSVDLRSVDSYRREVFSIKGIFYATPALTLTGGYAYESYRYSDAQFNGYQNILPIGATATAVNGYLTGLYANPSYKANIVFLGAAYKF